MDFDDALGGGCMAPVSSLGVVVSCGEDDRDGEAKAVLASYCVASAGGCLWPCIETLRRS